MGGTVSVSPVLPLGRPLPVSPTLFPRNQKTQVFNLDECRFSIRGMTLGRSKCVVQKGTQGNTKEPKFRGTFDHVTMMPVISASGQVMTPLFVLPGKEMRYREMRMSERDYEMCHDFLPKPSLFHIRSVAGVDTDIFFTWSQSFVEETSFLCRGGRNLLLIMDGYSCHVSFKTLSLMKDNGIVVAGLPAHTSHALKPLDVSVFRPIKQEF